MKFILLFVALNQQPAQLGMYDTEKSCQAAIRAIYTTRLISPAIKYNQQQLDAINRVVNSQLQYQQEYRCVAK